MISSVPHHNSKINHIPARLKPLHQPLTANHTELVLLKMMMTMMMMAVVVAVVTVKGVPS